VGHARERDLAPIRINDDWSEGSTNSDGSNRPAAAVCEFDSLATTQVDLDPPRSTHARQDAPVLLKHEDGESPASESAHGRLAFEPESIFGSAGALGHHVRHELLLVNCRHIGAMARNSSRLVPLV